MRQLATGQYRMVRTGAGRVKSTLSWAIVTLLLMLLAGHAATPAAVHAQGADMTLIVNAFIAGENAHDVEGVTALFADNASVMLATGPLQGTDQIRAWQQELSDGHFSIQLTSPLNITGSKASYSVTVALDAFRQLGFASLDGTEDMVVENGKITSFTFAFTPEAGAAFGAALAAASNVGMPTTGSPSGEIILWALLLAGLLLCATGYTLRRKTAHRA